MIARMQEELGPEEVLSGRLQGGRSPGERARLVPIDSRTTGTKASNQHPANGGEPWPGRLPPPSPAIVLAQPLPVALADSDGQPVVVSARILLSSPPAKVSVAGGPWAEVAGWAGPWPADDQWWAPGNRRRARVQLVTASGAAQFSQQNEAAGGWRGSTTDAQSTTPYAELHCHSNFSFLDGASHPEQLVAEAVTARPRRPGAHRPRRPLRGGALLRSGTGRRPPARIRCGAHPGTPTVPGKRAERTGVPDPHGRHLEVIARDPEGYARLSRAIAEAHLAGKEKGRPVIDLEDLAGRHGGHWLVLTGCRKGTVPAALTISGPAAASHALRTLVDGFGPENVAVELWDHGDPLDTARNDALAHLAVAAGFR